MNQTARYRGIPARVQSAHYMFTFEFVFSKLPGNNLGFSAIHYTPYGLFLRVHPTASPSIWNIYFHDLETEPCQFQVCSVRQLLTPQNGGFDSFRKTHTLRLAGAGGDLANNGWRRPTPERFMSTISQESMSVPAEMQYVGQLCLNQRIHVVGSTGV
ncbi:Hypothetical_protein [Hexamita inflata]|uniref:Hypothetical_protein n=1 Tax=Hexamita inflata TaxID=28002 RepID=A0AA86PRC2_9EUKA|nr:Hypothetical protein HINF_LOCUS27339 [Hexamita inflata]